jgi:hypothetical protein
MTYVKNILLVIEVLHLDSCAFTLNSSAAYHTSFMSYQVTDFFLIIERKELTYTSGCTLSKAIWIYSNALLLGMCREWGVPVTVT